MPSRRAPAARQARAPKRVRVAEYRQPEGRSATGQLAVWLTIIVLAVTVVLIAGRSQHGRSIISSVQQFLLFYCGVFALIALSAAVAVGLLATDRIVMRAGGRVVAQAVHRGVSLAALAALIAHIATEILVHRSRAIDAVLPFVARHRTLYVGLGTIATDLIAVIIVTGLLRGQFAGRWPRAWRVVHALAYLVWPLAVVHGLMAGRTAKPYVDWSYGGCLALVALALAIRSVATLRSREEKLAHPVADHLSGPVDGLVPGTRVIMVPPSRAELPAAGPPLRWAAPLPWETPAPLDAAPLDSLPPAEALPPFGTRR